MRNKKMKLREMVDYLGGDVVIYQNTGDDMEPYLDLYQGNYCKIPEELLDREVRMIVAKKKNVLDIWVRNEYGKDM